MRVHLPVAQRPVRRVREGPPVTGQILADMEKVVDTVLGTPYWSGLPSRFADRRYVKYKLEPEVVPGGTVKPDFADPFYLRADLSPG